MPDEPGWYPDPAHPQSERYWDGSAWTDHVWTAEVWTPPVPPPPIAPSSNESLVESDRRRVPAAVVFVTGLLSIVAPVLTLLTLSVPVLALLTMYLSNRYEDGLQVGASPSRMARAGWWMAASMLLFWFLQMVQEVPSILSVASSG